MNNRLGLSDETFTLILEINTQVCNKEWAKLHEIEPDTREWETQYHRVLKAFTAANIVEKYAL